MTRTVRRMSQSLGLLSIMLLTTILGAPARSANAMAVRYAGVSLAGGEFTPRTVPGTYGVDYIYPTPAEVDYFRNVGMNTFRLPFLWERVQHSRYADLDQLEMERLDATVRDMTGKGAFVILDPHNYARYYGQIIGPKVPKDVFADLWRKLAAHYANNDHVIFGLMNEPYGLPTTVWRDAANAAIAAIRSAGASQLILVPGNGYSGAYSWNQKWYGGANASVMLTIVDPANNYAYEVHQYLDGNSSGTSAKCVSPKVSVQRLKTFTDWLIKNGKRGFLGEFAGGRNQACYTALDKMLTYLDSNSAVWLGWTYWTAGAWWGDYRFSLEPNPTDRPQLAVLRTHLKP